MSKQKFSDLVEEIDKIVTKTPDEGQVARLADLVKAESALHVYTFDHIKDPSWIKPLLNRDFFPTLRLPFEMKHKALSIFLSGPNLVTLYAWHRKLPKLYLTSY